MDQVETVTKNQVSPLRGNLVFGGGDAERALTQFIRAAFPFDDDTVAAPTLDADQWNAVAQIAWANNLTPLLYAAILQNEDTGAPAALVETLQTAYHQVKIANWVAFREVGELLTIFEREKIETVLLKGAALAKTVYPAIAMRPMGDVDVLFRDDDVAHARAILIARGFTPGLEPSENFQTRFACEQAFTRAGKYPMMFEVHWHLFNLPYYRARIPIEWFWQRTLPMRVNDQPARAFAPEAQIIHLAAHAALHHQGHNLLAAYDLALTLARYRDQINWDDVIQAARAFVLSRIVQANLARVRETWGVAAPAQVETRLARAAGLGERVLFAINTSSRVEARDLWDGMNLPDAKSRMRFFLGILFPSRDYMRKRYGIVDQQGLTWSYAQRLGRGAQMFARSVMAMAGNVVKVAGRRLYIVNGWCDSRFE
ncbi:MAG: nucleotidyltransferase family protein [Chloroflexi bacterium]|nr:nucleotidyltransferase family protein [Chloroflexota bacterium]